MAMEKIPTIIKSGGVGVLATDTLYGIVGSALDKSAVKKIYKLKKRSPNKPFIILISDVKNLGWFHIEPNNELVSKLSKYWPGPVSIVLPCPNKEFEYLHRGTNSLAFRLPAKKPLRQLLAQTGPLIAPSANPENLPPAQNIKEAKQYFGDKVDFYQKGKVGNQPSKLIKLTGSEPEVLRG
jgi:L-threonylcarbamoyladenylate synthase